MGLSSFWFCVVSSWFRHDRARDARKINWMDIARAEVHRELVPIFLRARATTTSIFRNLRPSSPFLFPASIRGVFWILTPFLNAGASTQTLRRAPPLWIKFELQIRVTRQHSQQKLWALHIRFNYLKLRTAISAVKHHPFNMGTHPTPKFWTSLLSGNNLKLLQWILSQ